MDTLEIFIQKLVRDAGEVTRKYFGTKLVVTTKTSKSDLLTQADLATNDFIVSTIQKEFPDHGIISEEMDEYQADAEYVWIVDPIDGTFNFSTSLPIYAVLIALVISFLQPIFPNLMNSSLPKKVVELFSMGNKSL
ncbi:MAG: hypothetical protein COV59_02770 [Candidatus Magasanikbacteria bacterium CG11_big_fil_rev_8_21_14_0_20_39_34]|uniref:Inositol monophosphatase n=1 Tax=Candidatus Magasanikbacteria bacterium CG11_big_fil_rev_8_21_14_0_20_39_34 TaxID=1974653 RepID=A0A2H0N5B3_9BACT|nr:MAG: hypothetical protein COV59_02770 [Candidatus Magasanikbacteria bacterium CG11_big_fil_rev_8_21_14_0_20_39_34]